MVHPFALIALAVVLAPFAVWALLAAVIAAAAAVAWARCAAQSHVRPARSSVYGGRVTHARHLPTAHGFKYPIFYAVVDLDDAAGGALDAYWPLTGGGHGSRRSWALAYFDEAHHLKPGSLGADDDGAAGRALPLAARVRNLVAARTGTRPAGPVKVMTHPAYFGYCFNPVSFYFCCDAAGRVEAVVAEVSNTPWGEMHCYVLAPGNAAEGVECTRRREGGASGGGGAERLGYAFPKAFHVSPFMDMEHRYDWAFSSPIADGHPLHIRNSMDKDGARWFDANLSMKGRPLTAAALAAEMIRLPAACAVVSFWIHWQAVKLFLKEVPYYENPSGAEASDLIGAVMRPVYRLQARFG